MNFTIKFRRKKTTTTTKFTVLRSLTVPSSAFQRSEESKKHSDETPMWLRLNFRVELQMNSHAKNLNSAIVYFHGGFFSFFTLLLLWLFVGGCTRAGRWSDLFFWSYLADFVLFNSSSTLRFFNLFEVFVLVSVVEWNRHKMKNFKHLEMFFCVNKTHTEERLVETCLMFMSYVLSVCMSVWLARSLFIFCALAIIFIL